eukprot:CAMPEP_0182556666 /NCGR_PEP_ID=MMETSP1324-20130603/856_1 /TAXON_ID=236786 /ORGANISM="Florenciella sp., Strain RCC1587" /LENGTH=279 /DNA_ID=CAMNT_0024768593 /DNA_START=226 /DNA_END=1061 /DNA_ORIENTATION=-
MGDRDDCLICCSPIAIVAKGKCGHGVVCGECVVRSRYLHDEIRCPVCKDEQKWVAMSSPGFAPDMVEAPSAAALRSAPLGLVFTDDNAKTLVNGLMGVACPQCRQPQQSLQALKAHVKDAHGGVSLCTVCLKSRKVFMHEQRCYSKKELDLHNRKGDAAINDDAPIEPHQKCKFCKGQLFFDELALALHVREKHFRCHLCERRGVDADRLYYGTYPQMEAHFRESHFLCEHPDCKDRQLENVFMTEFDLQAHNVNVHFKGKRGKAGKAARQINLNFMVG